MDALTVAARAAATGDTEALDAFVRLSQPDVWRLCSFLVSPAEAEDLAQEVYERTLRSLACYRGESAARTWLLAIARRVCADHLRRRYRRERRESQVVNDAERTGCVSDASGLIELQSLLGQLSTEQREAFVLTQVIGLTYQEAAEVCAVPIGTIRSRVARAREALVLVVQADEAQA
ncbi:MAG: sigma-70 family RNA polymerase sigma factor [Acidimicrobiales bacterium]|nr:sigma-70 family RNA polymerase sigma factor [Acidimicrobiales bacterium]